MNKMIKLVSALALVMFLSGCNLIVGEKAVIEPTEIGKILTEKGFEDEVLGPSRFRLERCLWICPSLIKIDASDRRYNRVVKVYMAEDDVFINVPVNAVLSLDRTRADYIFGSVPHGNGKINVEAIFNRYAEEILIQTARSFVARGTVEDFLANQEKRTEEFIVELTKVLKQTPFNLVNAGIREVGLPDEIVDALKDKAERKIKVEQQIEQKLVDAARLDRELEEARKKRLVDVEKAEAEKQIQRIIADGYSREYERYKMLDIMMQMAESDNKVFVPVEMLGSMALDMEMSKSQKPKESQ